MAKKEAEKSDSIVDELRAFGGVRIDSILERWNALKGKGHQSEVTADALIAEEFGSGEAIVSSYRARLKAHLLGK